MPLGDIVFDQLRLVLPNGTDLLRGISVGLQAGSTTALLGKSGSGKTTLLRTVNGLATPSSGDVIVDGKATRDWDLIALRRSIGYVIQETGLFPHMTVARNVGLAFELADNTNTAAKARTEEVLGRVGLDAGQFGDRFPWQLSGGQRQRAGLARALANDPHILLMDEPFGALDPITRAEMQTTLRDLVSGSGKTVLIVTHDLDEALFLADRVLFIEEGELSADLPRDDVMSSASPLVMRYVEAANRGRRETSVARDPQPR